MENLEETTKKLLLFNNQCLDFFIKTQNEEAEQDFFQVIKPFADKVKEVADIWREQSLSMIAHNKPKHIYMNQIENTYENIQHVSIQAFFLRTKEKRFKEMFQANEYVLTAILNEYKDSE